MSKVSFNYINALATLREVLLDFIANALAAHQTRWSEIPECCVNTDYQSILHTALVEKYRSLYTLVFLGIWGNRALWKV